jgi:hypothetical protein
MYKSTQIPIEIIELEDASFHIMVEARFKKIKGNFIIDTGASKTVLDFTFGQSIADSIEKNEDKNSSGINAMISESHVANIPQLKIGRLKIENFPCVLLDLSHVNALYKKYCNKHIAGLIGSDFLVAHKAIINYDKKYLKLGLTLV